jgi:hypothetical protein
MGSEAILLGPKAYLVNIDGLAPALIIDAVSLM